MSSSDTALAYAPAQPVALSEPHVVPAVSAGSPPAPRSRIALLDLARVAATLMMLQGHTVDALLDASYRQSSGYFTWLFFRGFTAVAFMFVSGFTFSMMTFADGRPVTRAATLRRLRRFAMLLALGYILHFPAARLQQLATFSPAQWQRLLAVDVLQCIAFMLAILQLTTLAPRRQAAAVLTGLTIAVVCLTPLMWRADWTSSVPLAVASYLSPATGSQFPLFPWLGYGALGAAVGILYARWRSQAHTDSKGALLLLGVAAALLSAAVLLARVPWQPLGETDFWTTSPSHFLMRSGLVCLGVAGIAAVSTRFHRRIEIIEALAQASLAVYVVHVCLVYGSPFNSGLRQYVGATQTPAQTAAWAIGMWAAMITLAWLWFRCRRDHARLAAAVRYATAGFLVFKLL